MVFQALKPGAQRMTSSGRGRADGAMQSRAQTSPQLTLAVDDSILGLAGSVVDGTLDAMLQWAAAEYGDQLVVKAKDDFYWKNGKVFPDDEFYPSRMTYFVDQFLFHQIGSDDSAKQMTLYELYKEEHPMCPIKAVRHSMFRVKSLADDKMSVIDLLTGKKLVLKRRQNETFLGIKRKLLMQGYIYYCGDDAYLSQGLVFHPPSCTKQILRYLADLKAAGRYDSFAVLSRFARLQLRHKRHRHVEPTVIYLTDTR